MIGIFLLVMLSACQADPTSAAVPLPTATNEADITSMIAPLPVAPEDEAKFVDSNLFLNWTWTPGLADSQAFAVRVWFEDQPPIEVWTGETAINAQSLIDSFVQDQGTYYWQVAVVEFSETNGFEEMGSEWSPPRTLNRVLRLGITPLPEPEQSRMAHYFAAQNLPPTRLIDEVRSFIYTYAEGGSQEHFEPDYSDALEQIYAYYLGEIDTPPHLLCDGRSTAMLTLLTELGIESRLIFFYGAHDDSRAIGQHTAVEVFNPEAQRWELHDPTADIFFVDAETEERASVERIVFGPLDTITGCHATGDCDTAHVEERAIFFQAFRYGYTNTFYVNPDRFDISRRFPENDHRNLAELLTGNPREFTFILDVWDD